MPGAALNFKVHGGGRPGAEARAGGGNARRSTKQTRLDHFIGRRPHARRVPAVAAGLAANRAMSTTLRSPLVFAGRAGTRNLPAAQDTVARHLICRERTRIGAARTDLDGDWLGAAWAITLVGGALPVDVNPGVHVTTGEADADKAATFRAVRCRGRSWLGPSLVRSTFSPAIEGNPCQHSRDRRYVMHGRTVRRPRKDTSTVCRRRRAAG